jgi:hypothetical protein
MLILILIPELLRLLDLLLLDLALVDLPFASQQPLTVVDFGFVVEGCFGFGVDVHEDERVVDELVLYVRV